MANLKIQGIASVNSQQKILSVIRSSNMESNCRFLFFDYSEFDIPTGEQFLHLINKENSEIFKINAELKLVTQNQGRILDSIPKGHKTVCKIWFDKESLSVVTSQIPIVETWKILNVQYVLSNE